MPETADNRQPWALILGASSGFGEATAVALANAGYDICGVHLDRRQGMAHVDEIKAQDRRRPAARRCSSTATPRTTSSAHASSLRCARRLGANGYVRVMMHSLAFGTLKPFLAHEPGDGITRKNMDMTLDVMAHSLVYWAQDVWRAGLFGRGSKIYAMTSEGSTRVVASYGAVSAAKSALESHCRQLAMEFARNGSGVTVNAIRAGVTVTPALMQIPEHDAIHRLRHRSATRWAA